MFRKENCRCEVLSSNQLTSLLVDGAVVALSRHEGTERVWTSTNTNHNTDYSLDRGTYVEMFKSLLSVYSTC